MAYNILKGNPFGGGTIPPDGYVLTWSGVDGYWIARSGPSGSFAAGGDLTGSSTSQTVIAIQNRSILNTPPTNGYVLTWVSANNRWEPVFPSGGSPTGSAGGDLSSTYPNPTVVKIQTRSVNSTAPIDGQVLTWDQADGYWKPASAAGGAPTGAAGGDLSSTYPNPTVVKIQTRSINAAAPTDGYVLTWDQTDGYWIGRPVASSSGTASGDLSGTYPSPTVIKIQTRSVTAVAPTDGYVLTWLQSDGYWADRPVTPIVPDATTSIKGKIKLAGDLGGTADLPSVLKINGTSVPSSPSANQILVATSSTQVIYSTIFDGYVDANANITGSKISAATVANYGVIKLAGDISGTATNVVVSQIQTRPINNTAPTDGYVLTWVNTDGYWAPRASAGGGGGSPTGSATGDLSGTYPSPTVAKIQTRSINAIAPSDGYVLTWSQADGYWAPKPVIIPASTPDATTIIKGKIALAGDLGGTADLPSVLKINGVTVTGAPAINEMLVATSTTNLVYSKIYDGYIAAAANIDGSKIAAASVGTYGVIKLLGDISGSATNVVVSQIQTRPVNNILPTDGYVLTWDQADGYWVPRPTASSLATGRVFQFANVSSDIATYFNLVDSVSGIESDSTATGNSGSGEVLIKSFATISGSPNLVALPKGIWDFNIYRYVDSDVGISQLRIKVYTRTAGGTETLLFTTTGIHITETVVTPETISYDYQTDTILNSTDRIVVKIYAITTSGATRTFHFVFDGTAHTSHFHTPIVGGAFTVGGDISGTTANATVFKLRNNLIASQTLGAAQDGYQLTWSNADGYWKANPDVDVPLSGDVTGSETATVVAKIKGNPVATQTLGASQDGYVLTWSNTDGYWYAKASAGGGATGAAGGDLTGTYPNPTVISMTNTGTTVASTTTGKFITNVGRRVKTTVTTTNLTVVDGYEIIIVGTLIAGITVTLPASPTAGDIYTIKDQGGTSATFNIIVSGNGNNIDGSSSYTLNSSYQSITVVFANSSWSIL